MGPVKSGFGLHLVFVNNRVDSKLPDLNDIKETLKRDWLFEKQKKLKDMAYAKLRQRYTVIIEKPKPREIAADSVNKKRMIIQ